MDNEKFKNERERLIDSTKLLVELNGFTKEIPLNNNEFKDISEQVTMKWIDFFKAVIKKNDKYKVVKVIQTDIGSMNNLKTYRLIITEKDTKLVSKKILNGMIQDKRYYSRLNGLTVKFETIKRGSETYLQIEKPIISFESNSLTGEPITSLPKFNSFLNKNKDTIKETKTIMGFLGMV